MDLLVIKVEKRDKLGSRASRKLRDTGRIPVSLYGLERPQLSLSIERDHAHAIFDRQLHLVDLELNGEGQQALVTDVQFDPLGDEILHVDFSRVQRDKPVTVQVAIDFEGHAKGIADGGVVNFIENDIEVECLPRHIPEKIVVDVSPLGMGENLSIADLTLPDGVKPTADPETVIVTVMFPMAAAPEKGDGEGDEEDETVGAAPAEPKTDEE